MSRYINERGRRMKYTSEQIVAQEAIGYYGESFIDHVHKVLNQNLADAIIENSEQDVVIHFSDFYEQPTEIIPHSVCMRRDVTIKPLVRCKDCKHWDNNDNAERCTHDSGGMWAKPNAYCSYGERREDERK